MRAFDEFEAFDAHDAAVGTTTLNNSFTFVFSACEIVEHADDYLVYLSDS
jgi:hypothetical protein